MRCWSVGRVVVAGLLCLGAASVGRGDHAVIMDRLLFEVNQTSYTQRQMEVYFHLIDVMNGKNEFRIVDTTNWPDMLKSFRTDMVIDQEAIRIGSFDPNRAMLEKAGEIIRRAVTNNEIVSREFARLGIDRATVLRSGTQVLRIENFRRSKQKQATVVTGREGASGVNLSSRVNSWLKGLEERSIVRNYDGVDTFVQLGSSK